MPRKSRRLGPNGECDVCGTPHIRGVFNSTAITCAGHRHASNGGGPCGQYRPKGEGDGWTCKHHGGGAPHVKAARERQAMEQRIEAAARKLIPDLADRAQITNPLETLLELASEANAFRESLRIMANELDGKIRYAASGGNGEQLRAEVATYRQALKDTTDLLVAIARLDIEKMLARVESRKVQLTLDAMNHGCDDAGLDDQQKRTVMAGVARHLRSVPRVA